MLAALNPNHARRPSQGQLKVSLAYFNFTGDLLFNFKHHNVAPSYAMLNLLDDEEILDTLEHDLIEGGTAKITITDREEGLLALVLYTEDSDDCTIEIDLANRSESFSDLIVGIEVVAFEKQS